MFLQMLKDEFPEVRLHIISKLELVNQGRQAPAIYVSRRTTANTEDQSSASTCFRSPYSLPSSSSPKTSSGE